MARDVMVLEAMAKHLYEMADQRRAMLKAEAVAILAEQGTADTWRIPSVGRVQVSVSRQSAVVENERAFARWVASRYPTEVEQRVRSNWQKVFLPTLRVEYDTVTDPDTGEVIPGLGVREGGQVTSVAVVPEAAVKAMLKDLAAGVVGRIAIEAGVSDGQA